MEKHAEIVAMLEAAGAAPMSGLELVMAAKLGNLDVVKAALDSGVDIDDNKKYRGTALMEAAGHAQKAVLAFLLERGASLHLKD
eukprot:7252121-Prymnesium_polylepis.1